MFSKYTFYWISKRANNKVYQVIIELPHTCSVLEAIEKVIPYFNQELEHISLNLDPKLYELFFAKKSGLPKSDYPGKKEQFFPHFAECELALDESQNLNQTGIQCFTLVERNPTALMGAEMQAGKEEGKNQDYGSGKDGKGNMANPGMLSGGSASQSVNTSSTNNLGQDVEQGKQNEVQKCCFCIPIGSKKSAKSEKLISLKMDKEEGKSLSASLIDNQQ